MQVGLTACMLSLFGHASNETASWLMDMIKIVIELTITHGLLPEDRLSQLQHGQSEMLEKFPRSIGTTIGWLKIDPVLVVMNFCKRCFALYPLEKPPHQCNHLVAKIPGGPPDEPDLLNTHNVDDVSLQNTKDGLDFSAHVCGEPLLRFSRGKEVPIRRYAFQNLMEWIARLLSRPDIENLLDEALVESQKPYTVDDEVSEIHQSRLWKEFQGPDGKQFTASSGNLTFAMFVDGINPFGNKQSGHHVSITFVVLVCLTLPLSIRFRPENIFLVGIVPGPREPSLEQMNWILRPIVNQLKDLWNPGVVFSKTHLYKDGRLIRSALLPFIADLPALRQSLGFPSATAKYFCSFCQLKKEDINILNSDLWPLRTCERHKELAHQARDANSAEERKKIFDTHGVRYSVLDELEYWDIIKYHVVDSMHNLLLGLISWHVRRFWSMSDMKNEEDVLAPITTNELMDLLGEQSLKQPASRRHHRATKVQELHVSEFPEASDDVTSDEDFDPLQTGGWGGK